MTNKAAWLNESVLPSHLCSLREEDSGPTPDAAQKKETATLDMPENPARCNS